MIYVLTLFILWWSVNCFFYENWFFCGWGFDFFISGNRIFIWGNSSFFPNVLVYTYLKTCYGFMSFATPTVPARLEFWDGLNTTRFARSPPRLGHAWGIAKSICRAMAMGGGLKWPNLDLPWISIEFRFAIPPIDELIVKGLVSKTLTFGHTRSTRTHDRDVLLYYCFCCTNRQMKRALDVFCCVHRLTVSPSNRNAQSDRYNMCYGAWIGGKMTWLLGLWLWPVVSFSSKNISLRFRTQTLSTDQQLHSCCSPFSIHNAI